MTKIAQSFFTNNKSAHSIIILANEEESIVGVLDGVETAMKAGSVDYEMIVVDDGSSNKTLEIGRSQDVKIVRHDQYRGCGAWLKSGVAPKTQKSADDGPKRGLTKAPLIFISDPIDFIFSLLTFEHAFKH